MGRVLVDGGDVMVGGGDYLLGAQYCQASFLQAFEGLGAGDLVNKMFVYVQDGRPAFNGLDDVLVPDLFKSVFAIIILSLCYAGDVGLRRLLPFWWRSSSTTSFLCLLPAGTFHRARRCRCGRRSSPLSGNGRPGRYGRCGR